jgi:hypothetical protein
MNTLKTEIINKFNELDLETRVALVDELKLKVAEDRKKLEKERLKEEVSRLIDEDRLYLHSFNTRYFRPF